MSKTQGRLTRERERLSRVWEGMISEQEEMRKQTDLLNGLTKQLEGFRSELGRLERINAEMGYKTDSGGKRANKFATDNAMLRESVLVQTCKVENEIKQSLDAMEKLLEREGKRLHKELERVRMEKFWNVADGLRGRNADLDPVEVLWTDEEAKLKDDADKVRSLRSMCWQRMHTDAMKLEGLRMEERIRQDREERRQRQQRHNTFSYSSSHQERKDRSYHSSTSGRDSDERKHFRRDRAPDGSYDSVHSTPQPRHFKSSYAGKDERPKLSAADARIIIDIFKYSMAGGFRTACPIVPHPFANIRIPAFHHAFDAKITYG